MATPSPRRSREIVTARVNRRPAGFVATLLALMIVFALAWVFFLQSGPAAPAPDVSGIQGTFTWRPQPPDAGINGGFSAVAGGNAGGDAVPVEPRPGSTPLASGYEAATRTETTVPGAGARTAYERVIGAWPPVWRVATHSPLDYQGLAAIVRTAVEDGDDAVGIKPIKDGDRTVWRAAMTLGGEPIELVVDQETGIVTWYADGRSTFTAEVDWASPPPSGQTYAIDTGSSPAMTTVDRDHTYRETPAAAGRAVGFDPLVSDLAPDGFALRAVATFAGGHRPPIWVFGPQAKTPRRGAGDSGIAQLYTRGLNWFTIEQVGPKATRLHEAALRAGLQEARAGLTSYQTTTLQYGALSGATAATWYQASGPSLFVVGKRRAVFVTGALTRQELISFAEGLRPLTPGAGE
jgi:hypothetical protein